MRIYTILLSIFLTPILTKCDQDKKVHLTLETAFLLDPKHARTHLRLIEDMRKFLDKVSDQLEPQRNYYKQFIMEGNLILYVLKHFFSSALRYTDTGIESIIFVLKDYFKKLISISSSSYDEILDSSQFRRVVQNSIDQFSNKAPEIKNKIHDFLESDNPLLTTVSRSLSKYYTKEDLNKFDQFIYKFNDHAINNKDPSKLITDWLDFILVNRFKSLNETSKRKLLHEIKILTTFLNDNSENDRRKLKEENASGRLNNDSRKFNTENATGSVEIKKKDKVTKKRFRSRIIKVFDNDVLRFSNEDIVGEREGNEIKAKNEDRKTQLIIDNVEFMVQTV